MIGALREVRGEHRLQNDPSGRMLKGGTDSIFICARKLQLARPVLPRRNVWEGDLPKRVW